MKIGEVCLLTNDAPRLAAFYRQHHRAARKKAMGAINMSFYDPDNNIIYFRSFPKV